MLAIRTTCLKLSCMLTTFLLSGVLFSPSAIPAPATESSGQIPSETKRASKIWIRVDPKRSDLLVFTNSGQGLNGKFANATDVALTATPGTVLSQDNKTAMLHNGCIYLECQKGSLTVGTRLSNVKVPEGIAILLELNPASNSVHLCAFAKDPKAAATLTRRKGRETHTLHDGEEISFSEKDSQVQVRKFKDDKPDFPEDILSMTPLFGKTRAKIEGSPLHMLGAQGTEFRISAPKAISLRYGQIFAEIPDTLLIQTPVAEVFAGKGAILDVEVDAHAQLSRVKSLSQSGSPAVACGTQKLNLVPGHEVLISTHKLEDSDLYPPDGIGRRRHEPLKLQDKFYGASFDFSMISFLNQCDHVDVIKKALSTDMKDVRDKILKTASAVQMITSRYGAYRASSRARRAPRVVQQRPSS